MKLINDTGEKSLNHSITQSQIISWGSGIAISFTCFVIFMSSLVIKSFRQNFDLVHEDYYGEELKYQDRINRGMKSSALKGKFIYSISKDDLILKFPEEMGKENIQGDILFFRPSDKKKDVKAAVNLIHGEQRFPISQFSKGLYKIQISWEASGTKYFNEETIIL
jgi:hypothetical protein